MGLKANMMKTYLKDKDPKRYKEMKDAGTLDQHCQAEEDQAEQVKNRLMQGGWRSYEADEIARAQMFN